MKKISILPFFLVISVILFGQTPGIDYKTKGLEYYNANKTDSALIFFKKALEKNKRDGEILGILALIYLEKGDAEKSIGYARNAQKHQSTVTVDAYIAGVLASEIQSKPRRRDRWLDEGLRLFPGDYLLLYHAGRNKIPYNLIEGEKYLLRSVYANPAFAESHLLLGENMVKSGENLKGVLPLFYFLLLDNGSQRSKEVLSLIERLFQAWASEEKGISKFSLVGHGFKTDFVPEQRNFKSYDISLRSKWVVKQTMGLFMSLQNVKTSNADIVWEFYSDFFLKAVELNLAEPLAWHLVNGTYPAEVMEWIASNGAKYKEMIDWLSIQ